MVDEGIEDVTVVVSVDVQVEGQLAGHVGVLVHAALDHRDGLSCQHSCKIFLLVFLDLKTYVCGKVRKFYSPICK